MFVSEEHKEDMMGWLTLGPKLVLIDMLQIWMPLSMRRARRCGREDCVRVPVKRRQAWVLRKKQATKIGRAHV